MKSSFWCLAPIHCLPHGIHCPLPDLTNTEEVPRFVSELLRHDFPGQKLNVRLGEHKQNFGGGSYFDAFGDPPVLLSWEEGKYWKPFSRRGNNFNLQPWIEWSYLRQDSELGSRGPGL